MVGTDLAFGLVLSIFGGGVHASMSGIPWAILGQLLIGGIPAVLIGTQLATVLPPKKMRLALCVWLIYIGGQLSYRSLTAVPFAGALRCPAINAFEYPTYNSVTCYAATESAFGLFYFSWQQPETQLLRLIGQQLSK